MPDVDVVALGHQVLWATFALSIVFGVIAQKTHFCTMGAVGDILNIGDWSRMRMWALAIGVAMLGFNAMVYLGWVEAGKSIYAGTRLIWLSNLVGGALFGVGMDANLLNASMKAVLSGVQRALGEAASSAANAAEEISA